MDSGDLAILDWFKSYLSGRSQWVSLGDLSSGFRDVVHGVPQGSILRPLLFLIFINDLPNISDKFKFTLFTDDSALTYRFNLRSESQSANEIINHKLSKIYNWLFVNKIKINIEKRSYVLFNCRQKVDFPEILIGNGVSYF